LDALASRHWAAALYSFLVGALVLRNRKGTVLHTWLGRSFVAAMIATDLTAFALVRKYGWSWLHALAAFNLAYIALGLWYAWRRPSAGWIVPHFYSFSYAYLGVLAAAAARMPGLVIDEINVAALITIGPIFGIGAVLIERTGRRLRARCQP
jgi:uncharacterized membrane protein